MRGEEERRDESLTGCGGGGGGDAGGGGVGDGGIEGGEKAALSRPGVRVMIENPPPGVRRPYDCDGSPEQHPTVWSMSES